jgi:lysophospholipase L1-like esterase
MPEAETNLIQEHCSPAETFYVEAEHATLPPWSEVPWRDRYVPRGIMAAFRGGSNTGVPGSLDISSLEVRDLATKALLERDGDYLLDETFGSLCLPSDDPQATRKVVLSYRFSYLRLDSILRTNRGELLYVKGVSALANPVPASGEGVANVLVPYFGDSTTVEVWRVSESHPTPPPESDLSSGDIRIVFIGDSVTEGGEATSEHSTFRQVALRELAARFPNRRFSSIVAAVGGSHSGQWLSEDVSWDWNIVTESGAQIAVVEFLNDASQSPADWPERYDEIRRRLSQINCKVLFTTPPFTFATTMNDPRHSGVDRRAYTAFLRDYCRAYAIPLADVSLGWETLRERGIPYWTLLANGVNHPDDRGHELAGSIIANAVGDLLVSGDSDAAGR